MVHTNGSDSAQNPTLDAFADGIEKVTKAYEQGTALGKGNAEALMESSKIATTAAEEIAAEVAAYTRIAVETGTQATKALQAVKSVDDLVQLQLTVSKNVFESYSAFLTRVSDITTATVQEAVKPLKARVKSAAEFVSPVVPG